MPPRSLLDIPAPAKLNLFLHVTGRRPDGYHLLQSVFMLVDWCDTLHFERRDDDRLARHDIGPSLPPDDLVLRAARALQARCSRRVGVDITVEKRVPMQAGLGGGSSDAASCLLALNRLWGLGLACAELERIGLELGADVPFFLRGENAWVEGVGERIERIDLPPARFVIVKPAGGLETARVFQDPRLERNSPLAIMHGFAADPYGFGRNDLQPVAERLCPDVSLALRWLETRGLQGRMSGSGSAVFALDTVPGGMPSNDDVPAGWSMRVCGNLAAHPLRGWATNDE